MHERRSSACLCWEILLKARYFYNKTSMKIYQSLAPIVYTRRYMAVQKEIFESGTIQFHRNEDFPLRVV